MTSIDAVMMMIGASFAVFLGLGQIMIKNRRPTNLWLALLLISCSVWIILAVVYRIDQLQQYPHLTKLHVPFLCITGPLWYKYIYCLHETDTDNSFRYHLIIPVAITVCLSIPFYLESGTFKRDYVEFNRDGLASAMMYTATRVADITVFAYCIKSMLYMKRVNDASSVQGYMNTTRILWFFSVLATLAGASRLFGSIFDIQTASVAAPTMIIACLLASLFLLSHRIPVVLGLDRSVSHIRKVTTNDLLTLEECRKKLTAEKWFLDPNLKLQKLARKLEMPPNLLSELINQAEKTNFNEFINKPRIEYAKSLIAEKPQLSNDDVAELSGFNSRSLFYKKFKQFTGITPTQYKKKTEQAKC